MTTSKRTRVAPAVINIPSELDIEEEEQNRSELGHRSIKEITTPPYRKYSKSVVKAGLLPPSYYKNPQTTGGAGATTEEIDELKFKDPLSRNMKNRLLQTYQDYTVCSAIATLIHYVLGTQISAKVYPVVREQLQTEDEVTERLNAVVAEFGLGPTSIQELQTFVDMVDLNCELYEKHLPEAMGQSYVFGRAALWIVRANSQIEAPTEGNAMLQKWGFKEGVPVSLRPLDSINLGQVTVDTKSWEPKRIEYLGNLGSLDAISKNKVEAEEIDIEDLIYFTRDDYNIISDSYNYGFSRLIDAVPLSENKRRLTKKVFAEINNNQWSGLNIYQIPGMSQKDMQAFALSLKPGRSKVTNQPITVHNINPQFDMQGNLAQLKDLTLGLLSAVKVPSFLMNFEQITNRATTESILIAWQQTVLEAERNWIRTILWKYWYRPLIEFFFPDKEFLYLRIKILNEFKSIEFASLFERAIAINNLYNARIITVREARELLNLPPFPPEEEQPDMRTQNDIINQLLKGNPDLLAAQQQENQKLKNIEQAPTNPSGQEGDLSIRPGSRTSNDPQAILTKIRNRGKGGQQNL